jgi:putative redox protein
MKKNRFTVLTSKQPQTECEGYPPIPFPSRQQDEQRFYLLRKNASNLACSMIYHESNDSSHFWRKFKVGGRAFSKLDRSKKVVIICHGAFSWRNQMLFVGLATTISQELSCHTLRFDFSGNGHSEGKWKFSDYNGDFEDLCSIVDFVHSIGCEIAFIMGHSQGSFSALKHASEYGGLLGIPLYVNLAGRFVRKNEFDPNEKFSPDQMEQLKSKGHFNALIRGGRAYEVTLNDIEKRRASDISDIVSRIEAKVLTIHGGQDEAIHCRNANAFAQTVKNHTLHVIPKANHNFNGFMFIEEIVNKIREVIAYLQN